MEYFSDTTLNTSWHAHLVVISLPENNYDSDAIDFDS